MHAQLNRRAGVDLTAGKDNSREEEMMYTQQAEGESIRHLDQIKATPQRQLPDVYLVDVGFSADLFNRTTWTLSDSCTFNSRQVPQLLLHNSH